ncbi:hypothetical protein NC99_21990 [Sunxiuqinia dokdonensis]|uniref:Uncharacterized protein n=1 Tax=Sunxiuqinia dokdonensis TaxID=1409788 RepID=A0A0L8V9F7_9BACT|nr:hypothetical protein NC99_21990 [Sunxiuqinia dokdonensis]
MPQTVARVILNLFQELSDEQTFPRLTQIPIRQLPDGMT